MISVEFCVLRSRCTVFEKRAIRCDKRGSRPSSDTRHRRKISICELASKGKLPLNLFPLRGKSILVLTWQKT